MPDVQKKPVKISNVDELRCSMLMEKCGGADKNLMQRKTMRGHVQNPEILSPTDDNGCVMVNRRIKPKWYERESLSPQLADILQDYNDEDETESGSDAEQFSDEDGSDSDSDDD